jgi:hypothetical protein
MQKSPPPSIDRFDRIAKRGTIGYYRRPKNWRAEFWWHCAYGAIAAVVLYGAWRLAPIIGLPEW